MNLELKEKQRERVQIPVILLVGLYPKEKTLKKAIIHKRNHYSLT